jgi:hypothetical protein
MMIQATPYPHHPIDPNEFLTDMKKFCPQQLLVAILSLSLLSAYTQHVQQQFGLGPGLRFEENKGQVASTDGEVQHDILFILKDKGMNVYFRKNSISYQWHYVEELMEGPYRISEATGRPVNEEGEDGLPSRVRKPKSTMLHTYRVDMQWLNASEHAQVISEQPYEDYTNYYHAHCPEGIHYVKSFGRLTYKNMYPGIDIVYYVSDGHLKYDVLVAAGADISNVKFTYAWANPKLEEGKLKLFTPLGWLEEQKPVAWDEDGKPLSIKYTSKSGKTGFKGATTDKAITIDPGVIWATYYGGSAEDAAGTCSVDGTGNVYLSGGTASTSGIASGGQQNIIGGGTGDAFLAKFSSVGARVWATYYGGTGSENYTASSVDGAGNVFLSGHTTSTSGIASGGHQNTHGGGPSDSFLAKFSTAGVRQWGTYYGGTGEENYSSCSADGNGNVYLSGITTSTSGIASGGHQDTYGGGGTDGFLVKFSTAGVHQWSTYYGGSALDEAWSCSVDGSGNVYLGGWTLSSSGIASGGHKNSPDGLDAFLAKFSTTGVRQWATYYGGAAGDAGYATATDGSGNAYLSGWTKSTTLIASSGAHQTSYGGGSEDAFLVKFNSSGVRQWATYYGGTGTDHGYGISADASGNVYLSGLTKSESGIASGCNQSAYGGLEDAFLVKFSASGARQWATYYGGGGDDFTRDCAVDGSGNVYFSGYTTSTTGIANGGHQNTFGGIRDAFLVKFIGSDATAPQISGITTPSSISPAASVDVSLTITDPESGLASAKISYGPATSNTFTVTNADMNNSSGNTWTFTIPSSAQSELGVRYQVTATNAACLPSSTAIQHVKIDHSGEGLTIPFNSFGSAQTNYRIISLPLNLTSKSVSSVLGDDLGAEDKSKWRLWSFNTSTDKTDPLSGSSSLDYGKGYWLIVASTNTLDTGPGQTVGSSDDPVRINVSAGWNLIGNPYPFNILWSDITTLAANSSLGIGLLHTYTGGQAYNNPSTLKAFEGAFVLANSAGQLTIPGVKNPSAGGRIRADGEELRYNSIDTNDWEVRFSLRSGEVTNMLSGLGMHPEASPEFDRFDGFTLPRFLEFVELNHDKLLHNRIPFSRDIVAPSASHEWRFKVESSLKEKITLAWENQHIKESRNQLVLRVNSKNFPINMALTNTYTFNGSESFTVFYGEPKHIHELIGHFGLALLDPYPNPSSGLLEIGFIVPESIEDNITLDLVDPLGRSVADIANQKFTPGHHHMQWNASDHDNRLSPGLYLVRIRSGKEVQYSKVLLK